MLWDIFGISHNMELEIYIFELILSTGRILIQISSTYFSKTSHNSVLYLDDKIIKHPVESGIYSKIIQYLMWPILKAYVKMWVKTFPKCQSFKKTPNWPYE